MDGLAVVIPTRGDSPTLRTMLRSLDAAVPAGAPVHVALVVDGDDDVTDATVGFGCALTVLHVGERRGPAHARNRGVASIPGDVIAFLDDDVVAPSTWFRDLLPALDPDGAGGDWDLLGGGIRSVHPHNPISQMFEALVIRHSCIDDRWFLSTADVLVRRAAFERLGGFDERFPDAAGEDWDLCRRAHAAGLTVTVSDAFHVLHWNPTHPRDLVSRAARYAASSPLRFASWRPRFDGTEEPVVRLARTIRQPLRVLLAPITVLLPNALRRYHNVRRQGHGRLRALLLVALNLPWFLTYAAASYRALRAHERAASGVLLRVREGVVEDAGAQPEASGATS